MRRCLLAPFLFVLLTTAGDGREVLFAAPVGTLVKYEPMPETCIVPADEQRAIRRAEREAGAAFAAQASAAQASAAQASAAQGGAAQAGAGQPGAAPRALMDPLRTIRDGYPSFAAVSVDIERNEVILTDENLFQVLAYDRTENTPAGAKASTPKRIIVGEETNIEFQSGVYVDQGTGDIYAANNDTRDTLVVFKQGSVGDVKPIRQVKTPHGTFGVLIDEQHQELFMTEQHDSAIVVYRKDATLQESPIRYLQGAKTGLQDPHGIAHDAKDDVIFVANYGYTHDVALTDTPKTGVNQADNRAGKENWPLGREFAVPGSGTINAPSITIYARNATGNAAPIRKIQGPDTKLNWPTGLSFDPQQRELFVANDAANEILVFDAAAKGNAKPKRMLKGAKTKLANPTSVFVDPKNRELWVANFGGHSATVYDLTAAGDTAPKRTIRNAPEGTPSLMIGNPGAVGFDPKREQILVPNCVAHPQIAVFARLSEGQADRIRAIEGQKTLLGRTMHAIAYDEIHDEIYVTQQFGQAILVFRGGATGEEAPVRVINGSKTGLIAPDRLAVDPVNNEIYVPEGVKLSVFSRTANGNVAPVRIITGPDTGIGATRAVAIDPVRNLIVAATQAWDDDGTESRGEADLRIFPRTANGNVKPLRVISGLRTMGNIAIDSATGLVFTMQSRFVGVWHIDDNGKVPPRFTIGGPKGIIQAGRGLALDPKNQAVITSDKQLNAVMTWHVPEIFGSVSAPSQAARAAR
jgi:DNA-binding beta-propeller fold protein YncE